MKITILAIGKIKERWLQAGIAEYRKRLERFADLEVIELPDAPDNHSVAEACRLEGERLLQKLPANGYKVALDLHGEAPDSLELSARLEKWFERGGSHVVFVIAGSNGFAPGIVEQMDTGLSLSRLTFPHQLTRLILLEQLFRAFKISRNETYHK